MADPTHHLPTPAPGPASLAGCLRLAAFLSLANFCPAQVADLQLPQSDPSPWSSGARTKTASNSITASGPANGPLLINGTAQVTFVAGGQINLEPGFHATAEADATFHATIAPAASITFQSIPSGRSIRVDGAPYTTPFTLQLFAGPHTVDASLAQSAPTGTRYTFQSWSDTGAAAHTATTPPSPATFIANFTTQYQLTTSAGTGGAISQSEPSGWYNSGTQATVTAVANSGYRFSGFTGSATGPTSPLLLVMNGPSTITATFLPEPPTVSVTPSYGAGASQILTASYIDPAAYGQINEALLLIGTSAVTSSACLVKWTPGNHFYLRNETDSAWLDATSASVQNTRCRLDAPANGAQGAGQTLTVNFGLTFFAGFAGAKNVYLTTATALGSNPWQQKGTWTVDMTSGDYTVTALTPSATTTQFGVAQYQYKITAIGAIDGSTVRVWPTWGGVVLPNCLGGWNQASSWDAATRTGTVTLWIEVSGGCSAGFQYVLPYAPVVTWESGGGSGISKVTSDTILNCCAAVPPVTITLTPTSNTLRAGQGAAFTARVEGSANVGVTWDNPGIGILTWNGSVGTYTAPPSISTTQYVVITAHSSQDPGKTASATITLQPPAPTGAPAYVISGTVTQADGSTFGPIAINVTGDQAQTVPTDGSGNYAVQPLPAGHYVVTPSSEYGMATPASYDLFGPRSGRHVMKPFRLSLNNLAPPIDENPGEARTVIPVTADGLPHGVDFWWSSSRINARDIWGCWVKPVGGSASFANRDQSIAVSFTADLSGPHFVITFTAPPGTAGFRDSVCRLGGKDIVGWDMISFEAPVPHIDSLAPAYGIRGLTTGLTVNGTNLDGVTGVVVSGNGCPGSGCGLAASLAGVPSSTSVPLSITIAGNSMSGTYQLRVVSSLAESNYLAYTVADSTPVISSLTQTALQPGQSGSITIYGHNFGVGGGSVTVCTSDAPTCSTSDITSSVTSWTDTQINLTLSAATTAGLSPGSYDAVVNSAGISGQGFNPAPQTQAASSNRGTFVLGGNPDVALEVRSAGAIVPPITDQNKNTTASCAWIEPTPAMPSITVKPVYTNGNTGPVTGKVSYRLETYWDWTNRDTTTGLTWPEVVAPSVPATGVTTVDADSTWTVPWPQNCGADGQSPCFFGGWVKLRWLYQTDEQHPTQNQPAFYSYICGRNPSEGIAIQQLHTVMSDPTKYWFVEKLAWHETAVSQFCQPGRTNSSYCSPNHEGWPVFGPPAGYGLLQRDPLPKTQPDLPEQIMWNWKTAILSGKAHIDATAGPVAYSGDLSKPAQGLAAYPFWIRQVQQWNLYNDDAPANRRVAPPGTLDPLTGEYGTKETPSCTFTLPLNKPWNASETSVAHGLETPIAIPSAQQSSFTAWFGDAILIKQFNGASKNYVSWQNADVENQRWVFNVGNSVSANTVQEVCSCSGPPRNCLRLEP